MKANNEPCRYWSSRLVYCQPGYYEPEETCRLGLATCDGCPISECGFDDWKVDCVVVMLANCLYCKQDDRSVCEIVCSDVPTRRAYQITLVESDEHYTARVAAHEAAMREAVKF